MPASSSSSNYSISVVAATSVAAIGGIVAGYYYRSVTSGSYRKTTLKVPKSLLQSPYAEELKLATQLAMKGMFLLRILFSVLVSLSHTNSPVFSISSHDQ